jgi:Holliday junction DNA helicase RuvA
MIGQIRGIILEKQAPQLLVDVQGVGYEIDAPMSTFYQLPDLGQQVILFTHFVVREDAHHLYGFFTRDERLLFRTLLKVNGVGPRLALTNDTGSLVRLPGIGKKTAERLVIEMRDKLEDWSQQPSAEGATLIKQENNVRHQALQDAISALISLGYKQQEANRMVTKIDDGAATSEELIRRALREMM